MFASVYRDTEKKRQYQHVTTTSLLLRSILRLEARVSFKDTYPGRSFGLRNLVLLLIMISVCDRCLFPHALILYTSV